MVGTQGAQSAAEANSAMWLIQTQGVQGYQVNEVAGVGFATITGILITPSSGSPVLGIQAKGVQSGGLGWILGNSFLKVVRIA